MKKLFIDLEKCYKCKKCEAFCSYIEHPNNRGIVRLLELCSNYLICRRCEDSPCEKACPQEALEKQPNGVLKRYLMRCTSCKSCTVACPFGCNYLETVPYKASGCDYCINRINEGEKPVCVKSCNEKALDYLDIEEDPSKDIYVLNDNLAVHAVVWNKQLFKKEALK
ncbi:MAG: 4Fe-4S dicluster domain-containing protein [bacterium]